MSEPTVEQLNEAREIAKAAGLRMAEPVPDAEKAHPCANCGGNYAATSLDMGIHEKLDEILAKLRRLDPLVEYAEQMMTRRNTFMKLFAP